MIFYDGITLHNGIVFGPAFIMSEGEKVVSKKHISDIGYEINRIGLAIDQALVEIKALSDKARKEIGKDGAAIFDIHQMMLEDTSYFSAAADYIRDNEVNAEYAVYVAGSKLRERFLAMDDEYMRLRGEDVKDITDRLISILSGRVQAVNNLSEPVIVVADDLSPSDMVRLDRKSVLGFVLKKGSPNSHMAILARMMNVPAIIVEKLDIKEIYPEMTVLVNTYEKTVILEPDSKAIKDAKALFIREAQRTEYLKNLKGKDNITRDGRRIEIYANIGSNEDIPLVISNDAGGIGLFRTEFLIMERGFLPTEDEQLRAYKSAVKAMNGKSVVIRTLDIGVDKFEDCLGLDKTDNPALGFRGIRVSLYRPQILKTQLRAIFRAAVFGDISVMYPMIVSSNEVRMIREIVKDTIKELNDEGYKYRVPRQGIMIETPAAALISDELAEMVDFISIGTNDLTQYTLAMDRQNSMLDLIYDTHHKSILRLIKLVVDNAHRAGIKVGICGELAADTSLTETFINMGVDVLSVAPTLVLGLRETVRNL